MDKQPDQSPIREEKQDECVSDSDAVDNEDGLNLGASLKKLQIYARKNMMDDLEVGLKQNEDSMVGLKVCRSAVRLSQQQAQLALEESPPM